LASPLLDRYQGRPFNIAIYTSELYMFNGG
jgi:hypothetical protein